MKYYINGCKQVVTITNIIKFEHLTEDDSIIEYTFIDSGEKKKMSKRDFDMCYSPISEALQDKAYHLATTDEINDSERKKCVFCLIYTKNAKPYNTYKKFIEQGKENINIPLIIMGLRWNGLIGFPGGLVDKEDSSLEEAVQREVLEELGFEIIPEQLIPFKIFADKKNNIYSFLYEVTENVIWDIEHKSLEAKDHKPEGSYAVMQLTPYSIPSLLNQHFAGSGKYEFEAFINELNILEEIR